MVATAKEIADALRTAKALDRDALRDVEAHMAAQAESGAPTALTSAVIDAAGEVREALRHFKERLRKEHEERVSVLSQINAHGARFGGSWSNLVEQNNHSSIVAHEVYRAKRAAFHALLDVFETIGDRIVATPEEQAEAIASKASRESTERDASIAAWCKLSANDLATKATEHGIAPGSMRKRTIAILLVDAGYRRQETP